MHAIAQDGRKMRRTDDAGQSVTPFGKSLKLPSIVCQGIPFFFTFLCAVHAASRHYCPNHIHDIDGEALETRYRTLTRSHFRVFLRPTLKSLTDRLGEGFM